MTRDSWFHKMTSLEICRQELLNERDGLLSPYSRRCCELTSLELACDTKSKRYVQLRDECISMHNRINDLREQIKDLEFQELSLMSFILSLTSEGGSSNE